MSERLKHTYDHGTPDRLSQPPCFQATEHLLYTVGSWFFLVGTVLYWPSAERRDTGNCARLLPLRAVGRVRGGRRTCSDPREAHDAHASRPPPRPEEAHHKSIEAPAPAVVLLPGARRADLDQWPGCFLSLTPTFAADTPRLTLWFLTATWPVRACTQG